LPVGLLFGQSRGFLKGPRDAAYELRRVPRALPGATIVGATLAGENYGL